MVQYGYYLDLFATLKVHVLTIAFIHAHTRTHTHTRVCVRVLHTFKFT